MGWRYNEPVGETFGYGLFLCVDGSRIVGARVMESYDHLS